MKAIFRYIATQIRKELTIQSVAATKYSAKDVRDRSTQTPGMMYPASAALSAKVARLFHVDSPVLDNKQMRLVFFITKADQNICLTYDDIDSGLIPHKSVHAKIQENKTLKTGLNGFAMFCLICLGVAGLVF
jgi:hypothetical protein